MGNANLIIEHEKDRPDFNFDDLTWADHNCRLYEVQITCQCLLAPALQHSSLPPPYA